MKLTPTDVQAWVAAVSSLLSLAVPIAKLVTLVRSELSGPDADVVLKTLMAGWQAAKAENEARILELQAQIGA